MIDTAVGFGDSAKADCRLRSRVSEWWWKIVLGRFTREMSASQRARIRHDRRGRPHRSPIAQILYRTARPSKSTRFDLRMTEQKLAPDGVVSRTCLDASVRESSPSHCKRRGSSARAQARNLAAANLGKHRIDHALAAPLEASDLRHPGEDLNRPMERIRRVVRSRRLGVKAKIVSRSGTDLFQPGKRHA